MKTECIKVDGRVVKILPNAQFNIELSNKQVVLCYLCGKLSKRFIKPELNDSVTIEMSPTDVHKGRIIKRNS